MKSWFFFYKMSLLYRVLRGRSISISTLSFTRATRRRCAPSVGRPSTVKITCASTRDRTWPRGPRKIHLPRTRKRNSRLPNSKPSSSKAFQSCNRYKYRLIKCSYLNEIQLNSYKTKINLLLQVGQGGQAQIHQISVSEQSTVVLPAGTDGTMILHHQPQSQNQQQH